MPILNAAHTVDRTGGLRISRLRLAGETLRCALTADLHLSADADKMICGVRPQQLAEQSFAEIADAAPDLTVVAGDLAFSRGRPGDFRACRKALEPVNGPLAIAPGNHDHRERLLGVLARERDPAERVVSVVESDAVNMVVLDSLYRTDVVPGLLGQEQRGWLAGTLNRLSGKPTVVVVHHPPVDHDNALLDGDRLLAILESAPSVHAVFTAHDHVFRLGKQGSLWMVGLPAVGFAFEQAGGKATEPTGWVEAEFAPRGVALKLRRSDGRSTRRRSLDWRR